MATNLMEKNTAPGLSSEDLRAQATEFNRDRNAHAKWALGENPRATGNRDPIPEGLRRPLQPPSQKIRTAMFRDLRKQHKAERHRTGFVRRCDIVEGGATSSDDSCDPDTDGDYGGAAATKGSHPEADITYSFDAARSAEAGGREVLGQAVEKAIERWETGVTERLLKDEYEIILSEHMEGSRRSKKAPFRDEDLLDDGFEIV